MRNIGHYMMAILLWIVLAAMVYMLYGVLSQPMLFAAERQKILEPGYMPTPVESPQIDSKRFSRSEGYLYNPDTGITSRIELRSYTTGNETYYTGKIGHAKITTTPRLKELGRAPSTKDSK